jgi:hypothetical protein
MLYLLYIRQTLSTGQLIEGEDLDQLHLKGLLTEGTRPFPAFGSRVVPIGEPPLWMVVLQTAFALAVIIAGAHLFVTEVEFFSTEVLNVPAALIGFGNRMRVPQLSRSLKLLAEGSRSTGDLAAILQVAADDTRNRYRMAKKRTEAMSSYIAVVIIAFLVYLLVIALLEAAYLAPIAEISADTASDLPPSTGGTPVTLGEVPVEQYRVLFFHSAIIQAFGTGLLAGKLVDNRLQSGLKYSIGLVLLSIATFALL